LSLIHFFHSTIPVQCSGQISTDSFVGPGAPQKTGEG
jgi:hypothetical protein